MISALLLILFIIIYILFINYSFINKEEKFEKKKQYKLKIGFFDPYLNDKELEFQTRKKLIIQQIRQKMKTEDILLIDIQNLDIIKEYVSELKKNKKLFVLHNNTSLYISKHKLSDIKLTEKYETVSFMLEDKKINLFRLFDTSEVSNLNNDEINIFFIKNNITLSNNIKNLNAILPNSYEINSISKDFYKYNVLENEKDFFNFFILHKENPKIYNSILFTEDLKNKKLYDLPRLVKIHKNNNIYDNKIKIKTKSLSLYKYVSLYLTFN